MLHHTVGVQVGFVELIKKIYSMKLFRMALFLTIGASGGYAYYYFVGCYSGTCTISSNPVISTIYGALIGFLLTPSTKKKNSL